MHNNIFFKKRKRKKGIETRKQETIIYLVLEMSRMQQSLKDIVQNIGTGCDREVLCRGGTSPDDTVDLFGTEKSGNAFLVS
jgi:hypothetical protein